MKKKRGIPKLWWLQGIYKARMNFKEWIFNDQDLQSMKMERGKPKEAEEDTLFLLSQKKIN
jgi:hypothetical protein